MSPTIHVLTHIPGSQIGRPLARIMKVIKEVLIEHVPNVQKRAANDILDSGSRKRIQKRFYLVQKRKMRAAQIAPTLPHIRVALYIEKKKEVSVFRYYGHEKTGYAICPNCGYALEREFQKHCDQCGQLLGWKKFAKNEITVQRIAGKKEQRENAIRTKKVEKYGNTPIITRQDGVYINI